MDAMRKWVGGVVLTAGVLTAGSAAASDKPNIILIFTDDQGWADLGVHGQVADIRTPHLDQMAMDGALCKAGYVTAPQCSPSRAGLMTGRYQQRFGFEHNATGPLPLDEVTLADRLRAAGYNTGMVGKWHLEPNWTMAEWTANELGIPNPTPQTVVPFEKTLLHYPEAFGFNQYFKGELNRYWANFRVDGIEAQPLGEHIDVPGYRLDIQTDAALAFIERNRNRPFFLYLAWFAPHVPMEATPERLARFPGTMPERRRYALAMLSAMDDGIGRIRQRLAELELDEKTLIFFISDNGAPLKIDMEDLPISFHGGAWDGSLNTPWVGEKGMLMEGGIRVPFIVTWPGRIPAGTVCEEPVSALDVVSTSLAAAGLRQPADLDGIDLLPRLTGEVGLLPERDLFWKFWNQAAIRRGDWKYLMLSDGREWLFNLGTRQHEKRNWIERNPAQAAVLRSALEEWLSGNQPPGLASGPLNDQESEWYAHYLQQEEEEAYPGLGSMGPERTAFEFAADSAASRWVNEYIERFLVQRIHIGPTVFPREYLALSDSWLNDAFWDGRTVQEYSRFMLLDQQFQPDGYVMTQQHGATSHDHGWPFPHWCQIPGETGFRGVTAGWHFYDEPLGWEICYPGARSAAPEHFSDKAIRQWGLVNLESNGIFEEKHAWKLTTTGGFPVMTSPKGVELDPFNCPFVQIRWNTDGDADLLRPYMQWMREGDEDWCESRRMNFYADWLRGDGRSDDTGMFHSILPLYRHPQWNGKITRIRFCLAAVDTPPSTFYIRSIFTAWDTRHLVNNAIHIKAAFEYFRWTGDVDFLRREMPRLRKALHFMMSEGNALEHHHIRCTWHGHDGRPGYTVHEDGSKTWHPGHGKGGNYWDLLPLGWDDMYTTIHYYASLRVMAQLEEAVARHSDWAVPGGFMTLDPGFLRSHATAVKQETNRKFWNEQTGRFVGTIDADGVAYDYGFTFINLEAIHYGIASDEHAWKIMEWIDGRRIVADDTSTGEDIYAYRLAPRATTRRNVEWYAHAWTGPETLPFGGQVQDGGAVLGFSFYDIMSRIKTFGPDDAWQRLMAIREWDEEVQEYGGYRDYYGDGKGGTTLQGGGTAGGIGIDFEFTESSMLGAVIPLGFMGLNPDGEVLHIDPRLPAVCPEMTVRNLLVSGVLLDVTVSANEAVVVLKQRPPVGIRIRFKNQEQTLFRPGRYVFRRPITP